MKGHTDKLPDCRRHRNLQTIQGIDKIQCLRGLNHVQIWDYDMYNPRGSSSDGTKNREWPVRNHNYVMKLNEEVRREKRADKAMRAQFSNIAPLVRYLGPDEVRRYVEQAIQLHFEDERSPTPDLLSDSEGGEDDDPDDSESESSDDEGDMGDDFGGGGGSGGGSGGGGHHNHADEDDSDDDDADGDGSNGGGGGNAMTVSSTNQTTPNIIQSIENDESMAPDHSEQGNATDIDMEMSDMAAMPPPPPRSPSESNQSTALFIDGGAGNPTPKPEEAQTVFLHQPPVIDLTSEPDDESSLFVRSLSPTDRGSEGSEGRNSVVNRGLGGELVEDNVAVVADSDSEGPDHTMNSGGYSFKHSEGEEDKDEEDEEGSDTEMRDAGGADNDSDDEDEYDPEQFIL